MSGKNRVLVLVGGVLLLGCVAYIWRVYISVLPVDVTLENSQRETFAEVMVESGGVGTSERQEASPRVESSTESNVSSALNELAPVNFSERMASFSTPHRRSVFLKSYVTDRFSKEDLPYLYGALHDEELALQWGDVLFAICVLEEDGKALEVVKQFISTPWDWQGSQYRGQTAMSVIRRVMMSTAKLAMIDPTLSGPFLKDVFSGDGAERFLEKWRYAPAPEEERFFQTLTHDLIFGAATGLLHTRSPELFRTVEERFTQITKIPGSERTHNDNVILEICIDMLKERDLYNEMGWDKGIAHFYSLSDDALVHWKMRPDKYERLALELAGRKQN